MNKFLIIPLLIGISIIFSAFLVFSNDDTPLETRPIYDLGFTYYDVEKLKQKLSTENFFMSTPTAITDHTINQYCSYADDEENIDYCTTTAIVLADGNTLGNINMGGTTDSPIMALAIIDSSPFIDSRENEIHFVFKTMVETLVCECWEEKQPGGFESISSWLSTAQTYYLESEKTTMTSTIDGLAEKELILEITKLGESYVWTLIIVK